MFRTQTQARKARGFREVFFFRFAGVSAGALKLAAIALAFSSCSAPSSDPSDPVGKQGIIDATNLALSQGNCSLAVQTITPLYNSDYSDNNVRTITASAYACYALVQLFPLVATLAGDAGSLGGSGFWQVMAQQFPSVSSASDRVVEAAGLGIDALEAVLVPGQVILPQNQFNVGFNPGSILVSDRTSDSNFYAFFLTLAAIGGIENRYGAPNAGNSYQKTVNLPWTSAIAMNANIQPSGAEGNTTDGCEFASAVVNMSDTLGATLGLMSGGLASGGTNIQTIFTQAISDACNFGCTNTAPAGAEALIYEPSGGWVNSGCTVTTTCVGCPLTLRNRSSCTAQASDQNSCAASGIVNMVNLSVMGWQG